MKNNRKEQPVFSGLMMYFPNALKYVAWTSLRGNLQHHPDEPLHWDRAKSTDETDALARHLIDAGPTWDSVDTDGVLHIGRVAWRALAALEKVLERGITSEEMLRRIELPNTQKRRALKSKKLQ